MAHRFILNQSFQDPILCETVSRSCREDVLGFLKTQSADGAVEVGAVPDVEHGLVLSDTRGRGAFQ